MICATAGFGAPQSSQSAQSERGGLIASRGDAALGLKGARLKTSPPIASADRRGDRAQRLYHRLAEHRQITRHSRGDQVAVHDDRLVRPLGAGRLEIVTNRVEAG